MKNRLTIRDHSVAWGTLMFLAMTALGTGCGDPPRTPFTLRINSMDVVQNAVDQIEIVIRPRVAGQSFAAQADMTHFEGTITTQVTGAGEFAVFVDRPYIDAHAGAGDLMHVFSLEVPLLMGSNVDQELIDDPTVDVTFIRGTDRIGDGRRFLEWPLADGAEATLRIVCDRDGGFARQCLNNDPLPGSGPVADGGM